MWRTEIQDIFTSRSRNDDLEGQETAGLFLPELTFSVRWKKNGTMSMEEQGL